MANFRELLNKLKDEYPTAVDRGKEFEKICKWFLENDPTYADTFKNIWLWYEWPDRENNGFGQDIGIDLVGETYTGNLWAIQAKCYIDTTLETEHIKSFLSLSGIKLFTNRLLICTGKISANGKLYIENQDKPVQSLFYPELNKSPVNWLDSLSLKSTAYKSDPESIDYRFTTEEHLDRADTYEKFGENKKALESCNKAIKVNPYNARAYYNRGFEYFSGEHEKAIEDYSKAIELDPEHAEAYYHRGSCYSDLDEYEAAIEDYSKAIKLAS